MCIYSTMKLTYTSCIVVLRLLRLLMSNSLLKSFTCRSWAPSSGGPSFQDQGRRQPSFQDQGRRQPNFQNQGRRQPSFVRGSEERMQKGAYNSYGGRQDDKQPQSLRSVDDEQPQSLRSVDEDKEQEAAGPSGSSSPLSRPQLSRPQVRPCPCSCPCLYV